MDFFLIIQTRERRDDRQQHVPDLPVQGQAQDGSLPGDPGWPDQGLRPQRDRLRHRRQLGKRRLGEDLPIQCFIHSELINPFCAW